MKLIARDSGTDLFELGGEHLLQDSDASGPKGHQLVVVDRNVNWLYTAGFVLALLTFIPGVAGIVFLIMGLAGGGMPLWVAFIPLAVALVCGSIFVRVVRAVGNRRSKPLGESRIVAVFDLADGVLRDASEAPLAPLEQVRVQRKMQLTSSSPMLVARFGAHGQHEIVLARGNPFAGGLGAIEPALRERGVG